MGKDLESKIKIPQKKKKEEDRQNFLDKQKGKAQGKDQLEVVLQIGI